MSADGQTVRLQRVSVTVSVGANRVIHSSLILLEREEDLKKETSRHIKTRNEM